VYFPYDIASQVRDSSTLNHFGKGWQGCTGYPVVCTMHLKIFYIFFLSCQKRNPPKGLS